MLSLLLICAAYYRCYSLYLAKDICGQWVGHNNLDAALLGQCHNLVDAILRLQKYGLDVVALYLLDKQGELAWRGLLAILLNGYLSDAVVVGIVCVGWVVYHKGLGLGCYYGLLTTSIELLYALKESAGCHVVLRRVGI